MDTNEERKQAQQERVYTFVAEVRRIFSENFYLKPGYSRGRGSKKGKGGKSGGPYLYLAPEARKYKKDLIDRLQEEVSEKGFPYGKEFPYKVSYTFLVNKDRDVTNMIKVTEDALSEAIGVDDSVWEEVVAKKVIREDMEKEVVIIELYCR